MYLYIAYVFIYYLHILYIYIFIYINNCFLLGQSTLLYSAINLKSWCPLKNGQDAYAPTPTPGWRRRHILMLLRGKSSWRCVCGDVCCIPHMAEMDLSYQW